MEIQLFSSKIMKKSFQFMLSGALFASPVRSEPIQLVKLSIDLFD